MRNLCFLDGRVLDSGAARISPFDRGLLYGDGVYDVVRVRGGRALHLARHLERLRSSLAAVEIPEPAGLEGAGERLLAACDLEEGSLFFQVTRGVGTRAPIPPPDLVPTFLVLPFEQRHPPYGARPMRAVTMHDPRWARCDIKSTSLMGAVLGKLQARRAAADEVLFLGPDGALREGGSTSLFVGTAEGLLTHPLDGRVLPSLTRERVLAQAHRLGIPIEERAARIGEQPSFREAFLCGTLTGVQPLVAIDNQPVGDGRPGEWTRHLAAACAEEEEALLRTPVRPGR